MKVLGLIEEGEKVLSALLEGEKILRVDSLPSREFVLKERAFVITGLSSGQVLIRSVEMPLKKKELIYETLPFQIESMLPYSLDEGIVVPELTHHSAIMTFSCLKKQLQSHLSKWLEKKVDPDWVASETKALSRYTYFIAKDDGLYLHIYLGKTKTILLICQEGTPLKTTTLSNSEQVQIDRGLFYLFSDTSLKEKVKAVMFSGVKPPLNVNKFFQKELPLLDAGDFVSHTLPIGLALEAQEKKTQQFRIGKWTPARQKKRIKILATITLLGIVGLTLLSYSGLRIWQHKEKEAMMRDLNPYASMLPLENASLDEMRDWLLKHKEISYTHLSPYLVSNVYQWLSTYLKENSGIDVKLIKYKIEQFPTPEKPFQPFLASIYLSFDAKSADDARDFKEFILAKSSLTNIAKPLTWNRTEHGYEASLFLKNP